MYKYEHQAQYYETDQMGIIHHSNYIRWFESARIQYMQEIGVDYRDMEKEGIISPVLEVNCVYRSMVHFGDRVEIRRSQLVTRLVRVTDRSFYEKVSRKLGYGL